MIELFIEDDVHRRIVLKDRGTMTEFYVEDTKRSIQPGDLYLGIIKKKVNSLKSVFIDIGAKKMPISMFRISKDFRITKKVRASLWKY